MAHKIWGWTDEVTTCDCCGKDKLSGTFAVELEMGGPIVHYGSVCVKRNTGIKNPKSAAKTFEEERHAEAVKEWMETTERREYLEAIDFVNRTIRGHFDNDPEIRREAIAKRKAITDPKYKAYNAKHEELRLKYKLEWFHAA